MKRTILAVLTLSLAAAYQAPAQEADASGRAVAREHQGDKATIYHIRDGLIWKHLLAQPSTF